MKKLFLSLIGVFVLSLALFFTSCEKDDEPQQDCSCGIVTDWGVTTTGQYAVLVKNYCSGNSEWFGCDYDFWYYSDYGDEACSQSGGSWKSSEINVVPEHDRESYEKPIEN